MTTIKCPFCNKQSYGMAFCDHCGEEIPRNTIQPEPKARTSTRFNLPKPNINRVNNSFNQENTNINQDYSEPVIQEPIQQQQPIYTQPQQKTGGIMCPMCKNRNVTVQLIQTGSKSSHNSRGCLWSLMRITLIICTCGLWLIVGKSLGKSKTTFKNAKMCVCQSCGHSWKI